MEQSRDLRLTQNWPETPSLPPWDADPEVAALGRRLRSTYGLAAVAEEQKRVRKQKVEGVWKMLGR